MSKTISTQIEPGKWYRLDSPETSECCDCGMTHVTEYKFEHGRMFFKTRVDRRTTNQKRKEYGITITRKPHVKG